MDFPLHAGRGDRGDCRVEVGTHASAEARPEFQTLCSFQKLTRIRPGSENPP